MTGCPDAAALRAAAEDDWPPALADHLGECPACRARLDALFDEPIDRLTRRAGSAPPAGVPPAETLAEPWDTPRLPASSAVLPVRGTAVPGCEFLRELGRGGMGTVYLARQVRVGRLVAVKLMSRRLAGGSWRDRFEREARSVGRVRHPNVVAVYDAGEFAGRPYLIMEYADGGTLADRLAAGPLAPREAAAVVRDVARGVEAAHAVGVIHRDLKPANVLLVAGLTGRPAEPMVPKVSDFGVARLVAEPGLTRTGQAFGTPAYMAPEQTGLTRDPIGPATDVWGLGAVLYEALTGSPPSAGADAAECLARLLKGKIVPPRRVRADLPPALERVCLGCLRHRPDDRYPTAAAVADDLDRFLAGEPVRPPRRRLRWAGAAAVFVVAAVAAALALSNRPAGSPSEPVPATPARPAEPPPDHRTLRSRAAALAGKDRPAAAAAFREAAAAAERDGDHAAAAGDRLDAAAELLELGDLTGAAHQAELAADRDDAPPATLLRAAGVFAVASERTRRTLLRAAWSDVGLDLALRPVPDAFRTPEFRAEFLTGERLAALRTRAEYKGFTLIAGVPPWMPRPPGPPPPVVPPGADAAAVERLAAAEPDRRRAGALHLRAADLARGAGDRAAEHTHKLRAARAFLAVGDDLTAFRVVGLMVPHVNDSARMFDLAAFYGLGSKVAREPAARILYSEVTAHCLYAAARAVQTNTALQDTIRNSPDFENLRRRRDFDEVMRTVLTPRPPEKPRW